MASHLFNRYIWLIDTIHRSGKITFEDLNTKWLQNPMSGGDKIPPRTFHNHRTAIEKMFDINIVCNKSTYEYYIDNDEDIEHNDAQSWLLNTFAVNNLINESYKLKHRILFEDIPSGHQFLSTIIEAMRDGVKLEMSYQSYSKNESTSFDIEPYFLKIFKQRWYVIAKSDKLRIYALDRIKSLTVTNINYKLASNFAPESYFIHCFGIILEEELKPETIRLKVSHFQAKYFRDLPLHHSQKVIQENDDHSIFEYFIQPTFDFRQELLSMGDNVEIISPASFREEIKILIDKMHNIYK